MSTTFYCGGRSETDLGKRIEVFAEKSEGTGVRDPSDRRTHPRINKPFPARAWGEDAAGNPFNLDCVLDNLSAGGLYVRMPRQMTVGSEIRFVVRLSNPKETVATAGLFGTVVRDEPGSDGQHGIAISIDRSEIL